ncbi:hypothetical protein KR51_00029530 [Rubidibacter lacunae KORDI 51-2]|uniref:Uncharacterized protein n=1 Tax=Rubidibacter lacunae KORDI 51-2 TaxID=582515 RepID=U5DIJ5_9CHRO|nr:hypothetical protein [Rubidibacter lacunae]ERN40414.1 hypothetical protein KR51_00029530 [Rubidibacter lacunae KORDI 51-2]
MSYQSHREAFVRPWLNFSVAGRKPDYDSDRADFDAINGKICRLPMLFPHRVCLGPSDTRLRVLHEPGIDTGALAPQFDLSAFDAPDLFFGELAVSAAATAGNQTTVTDAGRFGAVEIVQSIANGWRSRHENIVTTRACATSSGCGEDTRAMLPSCEITIRARSLVTFLVFVAFVPSCDGLKDLWIQSLPRQTGTIPRVKFTRAVGIESVDNRA